MNVDDISRALRRFVLMSSTSDEQHIPRRVWRSSGTCPGWRKSRTRVRVETACCSVAQGETGLDEEKLRVVSSARPIAGTPKGASIGPDVMRHLEKPSCCRCWTRNGRIISRPWIICAGHSPARLCQKNPKEEYKRESFVLFSDMLTRIRHDVINLLAHVQVQARRMSRRWKVRIVTEEMHFVHPSLDAVDSGRRNDAAARPSRKSR